MARGTNAEPVKAEFVRHANEEHRHADRVAERIAVESCSEIVRWLGGDDPTRRRLIEKILKMEEGTPTTLPIC